MGRFVSPDPIGLSGGVNLFEYSPNPTGWIDPLGLADERPPNLSPPGAGRRGAFREAKRILGIPVCTCPTSVGPNFDKRENIQKGRTYKFGEKEGDPFIRDDAAGHYYGKNDPQNRGAHFNIPGNKHFDY